MTDTHQDNAEQDQSIIDKIDASSDKIRAQSEDPQVFVLSRELNEVHLLLDNLAANPTTNLAVAAPPKRDGVEWLPVDWIKQVCAINWPPDLSNEARAEDAALLIKVKDYLNSLTYPANGATIAFTLLVTQEEPSRPRLAKLLRRNGGTPPRIADSPSRRSMACAAYPDLSTKAAGFRWMMGLISYCLLAWLLATCITSWYVSVGNGRLSELKAARTELATVQARVDKDELAPDMGAAPNKTGTTPGGATASVLNAPPPTSGSTTPPKGSTTTTAPPASFVPFCSRTPAKDGAATTSAFESGEQYQACNALKTAQANVTQIETALGRWLGWKPRVDKSIPPGPIYAAAAASRANLIGSSILPVLYGFLGAAAAVVRALSSKTRASLLTPRDLQLSVQQLALGAVVGACIGLFITPTSVGENAPGLIGPVALSTSALSFVAGFGVDAVFQTLESLIGRIFNVQPPARSIPAPQPNTT